MKANVINLVQGSQEWLSYRRNKITATDTAKVLGYNPWCTPFQCWEEKLGFRDGYYINDSMKEGSELEIKAREFLNKQSNSDFKPVVLEHEINSFQIASLDLMDSKGNIGEIKCGKSSHNMAMEKKLPYIYFCQLQKQMWVADANECLYMSYRSDDDWISWTVERNEKFIKHMNEVEVEFYDCLINLKPPELMEKDYVIKNDFEWASFALAYKSAKQNLDKEEKKLKDAKDKLIELSQGKSSKGHGIIVSKVLRKGNIDYGSIEELKTVDLEKYRKEPISYMNIRNE